jgi:hypothetical protein
MSALTVTDTLPIGVVVDGTTYKKFTIRPGKLRDSIAAIDSVGADASPSTMRYATLAQRISFDGLDQDKVSVELLMDMYDRDAVAIENAAGKVEKKLDALSSS